MLLGSILNLQTKCNETHNLSGTLFSSSCTRDWNSEQISFLSKKEICKIVSYLKKS